MWRSAESGSMEIAKYQKQSIITIPPETVWIHNVSGRDFLHPHGVLHRSRGGPPLAGNGIFWYAPSCCQETGGGGSPSKGPEDPAGRKIPARNLMSGEDS